MSARRRETVEALREAVRRNDLSVLERLLADDVRWYGNGPGGCHNREQVLATLRAQLERGVLPQLEEARAEGDRVLLQVGLSMGADQVESESTIWFALTLDDAGRITELQDYSSRAAAYHDLALRSRSPAGLPLVSPASLVSGLVPFVEVADVGRSVAFYRLLGLELRDTYDHEGQLVWASMARESAALMLARIEASIDPSAPARAVLPLRPRPRRPARSSVSHGLTLGEIVDGSPGPKPEMHVTDPDGYCLMVAQIDDETISS